jgi:putative PIN family toxin of toxin-antitoxin system
MIAVLDTSVVVGGLFWRTESYRCLAAFARREFVMAVTESICGEYRDAALRLKTRDALAANPEPWLNYIRHKGRFVASTPFRRHVCRDPKDDRFLECALAADAQFIVSRDEDLLALQKPFGIEIITPRRFLSELARRRQKRT